MTIDEFLNELTKTQSDQWIVKSSGYIRLEYKDECYCPILAVAFNTNKIDRQYYYSNFQWYNIAKRLGLSLEDATTIVEASDRCNRPLRDQILATLGLKDPS